MSSAFVMGARHGLYCLGCCWALMALLFVGGVMNLAWIAALSIAVALEKLSPGGEQIATALGIALVVVGCIRLGGGRGLARDLLRHGLPRRIQSHRGRSGG